MKLETTRRTKIIILLIQKEEKTEKLVRLNNLIDNCYKKNEYTQDYPPKELIDRAQYYGDNSFKTY